MKSILCLSLTCAASLVLAGCSNGTPPPPKGGNAQTNTPAPGSIGIPAGMIVVETIQEATPVASAKGAAKVGEKIVVVGRIGGAVAPFNASRGVFTIVDPSIPTCDEGHDDDHCKTPWDYCCESPESLRKNMATVEITDATGQPLPFTVKGAQGLVPQATVTVAGTVTERNDQGVLVVRAERINVQPPKAAAK